MTYVQMITLFFHVYKVIFIIAFSFNAISVITEYIFGDISKSNSNVMGVPMLYWTLFIMSWYF